VIGDILASSFCHCEEWDSSFYSEQAPQSQSRNPKSQALNPEQYQKSNIKSQNDKLKCKNLPHFALWRLTYFCLLTFEFCLSEIATPSARNDILLIVTLSDSEGSEGDSSVAALPQNDRERRARNDSPSVTVGKSFTSKFCSTRLPRVVIFATTQS